MKRFGLKSKFSCLALATLLSACNSSTDHPPSNSITQSVQPGSSPSPGEPTTSPVSSDPIRQILARPVFNWSDDFVVSNDGTKVVYVLKSESEKSFDGRRYFDNGTPSDGWQGQLKLTEIATSKDTELCPDGVSCFHPSWSPDSRYIAYYSDQGGTLGLWEFDTQTGKPRQLVSGYLKVSNWQGDEPQWSPDGKTIFVMLRSPDNLKTLAGTMTKPTGIQDITDENSGPPGVTYPDFDRTENLGSIVAVDRGSGQVQVLISEQAPSAPTFFRLSSDGKWISYLSVAIQNSLKDLPARDLYILPRSGGTPTLIATGLLYPNANYETRNYRWHPSQDLLVFTKGGQLWKLDLNSGSMVPQIIHPEIKNAVDNPLLFNASGDAIIVGTEPNSSIVNGLEDPTALDWVPLDDAKTTKEFSISETNALEGIVQTNALSAWTDGKADFAAEYVSKGSYKIEAYFISSSKEETLTEGAGKTTFAPQGTSAMSVLGMFENFDTPSNLFKFSQQFQKRDQVTSIDQTPSNIGAATIKRFTSKGVNTVLLLPPGLKRGEKPATVVFGYPGDDWTVFASFYKGGDPAATIPCEVLLDEGYAVALVSLSEEGNTGEPIQEITAALLPQIDTLSQSGLVDPDRFALLGQSYGGYMAAAVPTATSRFKAAIAISGIYDLGADYGYLYWDGSSPEIQWLENGQGGMGGPPWCNQEKYLQNSPYYLADKIETPLLMIHGTADTSYYQVGEMFTALRRLGSPAELVSYPDEGHVPTDWTLTNHTDAVNKILQFLSKYDGPKSID